MVEEMSLLTWDLLLIPWLMGIAAILVAMSFLVLRKTEAPPGAIVGLMIIGLMTAVATLLLMIVIRIAIMTKTPMVDMIPLTEMASVKND